MQRTVLLVGLLGFTAAQRPARIGPDGKPLLNRPVLDECMKRKTHMKVGDHNYFLSWREPWHKFEDWDWFNGRNFCRDRCMDLVSFDTPLEYKMFEEIMRQDKISSVWTSGRKCNFQNKGCDGTHLQPINVNGWFWAGASNARIPSTDKPDPNAFWSQSGEKGTPQPDNLEGLKEGPIQADNNIGITIEGLQEFHDEACLVVLNNKYNDGIKWHDSACHFRSVIICEDSDQLISLITSQEGVDVRNEVELGTNAIDIDTLPQLPITAPAAPAAPSPALQQQQLFSSQQQSIHPAAQFPQQGQFNSLGGQFGGQPIIQQQQLPGQFQKRPSSRPTGVFGGLFNGIRLPFFRH